MCLPLLPPGLWDAFGAPAPRPPQPITLPPQLLFDWHRDYGPLWEPGSSAFWLEPEPGDIKPGVWPMPYIKEKPRTLDAVRWSVGDAIMTGKYLQVPAGFLTGNPDSAPRTLMHYMDRRVERLEWDANLDGLRLWLEDGGFAFVAREEFAYHEDRHALFAAMRPGLVSHSDGFYAE